MPNLDILPFRIYTLCHRKQLPWSLFFMRAASAWEIWIGKSTFLSHWQQSLEYLCCFPPDAYFPFQMLLPSPCVLPRPWTEPVKWLGFSCPRLDGKQLNHCNPGHEEWEALLWYQFVRKKIITEPHICDFLCARNTYVQTDAWGWITMK